MKGGGGGVGRICFNSLLKPSEPRSPSRLLSHETTSHSLCFCVSMCVCVYVVANLADSEGGGVKGVGFRGGAHTDGSVKTQRLSLRFLVFFFFFFITAGYTRVAVLVCVRLFSFSSTPTHYFPLLFRAPGLADQADARKKEKGRWGWSGAPRLYPCFYPPATAAFGGGAFAGKISRGKSPRATRLRLPPHPLKGSGVCEKPTIFLTAPCRQTRIQRRWRVW